MFFAGVAATGDQNTTVGAEEYGREKRSQATRGRAVSMRQAPPDGLPVRRTIPAHEGSRDVARARPDDDLAGRQAVLHRPPHQPPPGDDRLYLPALFGLRTAPPQR